MPKLRIEPGNVDHQYLTTEATYAMLMSLKFFLKAGTNIISSVFFRKHTLEAKIRGAQDFSRELFGIVMVDS